MAELTDLERSFIAAEYEAVTRPPTPVNERAHRRAAVRALLESAADEYSLAPARRPAPPVSR